MPKHVMRRELDDDELDELDRFLARIEGGVIPNTEALDGFLAALICTPDLVMPSAFMPVIQGGASEDGDLVFESLAEAERFTGLVMRHWNHVNWQLTEGDVYLPLLIEDETGAVRGNDWASGFMTGIALRRAPWADLMEDEEHGGPLVPILVRAHENDPDPELRPFDGPIGDDQRQDLIASAAVGVMRLHAHFLPMRNRRETASPAAPYRGGKPGRNDPCPCGSGLKYKKCCGRGPTLH